MQTAYNCLLVNTVLEYINAFTNISFSDKKKFVKLFLFLFYKLPISLQKQFIFLIKTLFCKGLISLSQ